MTEFDWANLPPDLIRTFAQAKANSSRLTDEEGLRILRTEVGIPGPEFFKDFEIRRVAARHWLPEDDAALNELYAELQGRVLRAAGAGRPLSHRRKLSAVRSVVNPPMGGRQSQVVREAAANALLKAGGALAPADEFPDLRPFNVVPTRGDQISLYPYQVKVVDALRDRYRAQGQRMVGVVVMPTGAGKTLTAVQWLLDHVVREASKVLWITHRAELLEQTADTFVRCAPTLADGRDRFTMRLIGGGFGPASTIADSGHDVVVATIAALTHDMRAVTRFLKDNRCVVVFDEAHHCVAPTWRDVLLLARNDTNDAVLGLTATPTRMGEVQRRQLGRLLHTTIAQVSLSELVATNYLAEARCQSVSTYIEVERLANREDFAYLAQYGELSPRLATALAENVPRNKRIVETYLRGPADGKDSDYGQTVVFAVTIDHAHLLARDFARKGVLAGAITSEESSLYRPANGRVKEVGSDRWELLQMFRDRELPVLVNVALLAEGVDVPAAKTAFLARPTGSEVLMSQMVGRALRGEKVGGTRHAYLVSFRDHWTQFTNWMDPILLPGVAEVSTEIAQPEPAAIVEPSSEEIGEELAGVDVIDWAKIFEEAVREVETHIAAEIHNTWSRIPVGLYMFQTELPVEATDAEHEELDARTVHLWVYEHDRGGFDALTEGVADGSAGVDVNAWLERFFSDTPEPQPAHSRLELLAQYVAAEGAMPPFLELVRRDELDPARIARRLYEADARRSEKEAAVHAAYQANPALVDAFFGGEQGLRAQVLEHVYRLEAGLPQDFDEIMVPRVRAGDRLDLVFGEGLHDLDAILAAVLSNRDLFPTPLPPPVGGIRWTEHPYRSGWAAYRWDEEAPGTGRDEWIEVNPLLDSRFVSGEVIGFLVYHELLHHQDIREGKPGYHDRDFRKREAKHPAIVTANAFLDTFLDKFAPVDSAGRPVPA